MTTPTPLTPQAMERLAFIRMLHQQGVSQSHLPQPLNFGCVLTFHDTIELFLLLASEQLGVTVPGKGQGFVEKHFNPINSALQSGELTGRKGVGRITDQRNAFKHANLWPSPGAIEGFRADTETFLEENTPKVFGIVYDEIDMADLVAHEGAREKLKDAASSWHEGERVEAMAHLVDAFDSLFEEHIKAGATYKPSPFSIGPTLHTRRSKRDILDALVSDRRSGNASWTADQLDSVTDIAVASQNALRVLTLGVDYHDYVRFQLLTPEVHHMHGGERHVAAAHGYAPTEEHYESSRRFVIGVALRATELQHRTVRPPWLEDS